VTLICATVTRHASWLSSDTTQLAGADIDKVPHRMLPAEVGPRAWRRTFAETYG
jgi:hypothetical protein